MTTNTDIWLFNIHSNNWEQCVQGPDDAEVHGEQNVNAPVQAVPENATAPIDDFAAGDLALARIKGRGVAGIWEVREVETIGDSQERSLWSDTDYSHIIYCDPLHRELDQPYEEDWEAFADQIGESVPSATGQIQGSVTSLPPKYEEMYLTGLRDKSLNEAAMARIESELGRNSDAIEHANFWMLRAGKEGSLWNDWNSVTPPIATVGWDIGDPERVDFNDKDTVEKKVYEQHDPDSNSPVNQLRQFVGGRDTHIESGDFVVILGKASVEAVAVVGELQYIEDGLPGYPTHTYWREVEYLIRSEASQAIKLQTLPEKFSKQPDDKHGEASLYDLSRTIQKYKATTEDFLELVTLLAQRDEMNVYDRAEHVLNTPPESIEQMPPQAIIDWLDYFEDAAEEYDVSVETTPNETFQITVSGEADAIGKVRYSASENRDYADEAGTQYIWQRFDRELERIESDDEDREVFAIQLDVRNKNKFDPETDNFLFIPEALLAAETSDEGNVKIGINGRGEYAEPFNGRANNWQALFEYATGRTLTGTPQANSPTAPFYWVNHNEEEFTEGYLEAPIDNLAVHDLAKLEEGDLVFNYFDGELKGFSIVNETANPRNIDGEDYWRVSTDTYEFDPPLPLTAIFEPLMEPDVRLESYYPLNPAGINQQYLFNLSQAAGDYILHRSGALSNRDEIVSEHATSPLTPLLDEPSFTFELPTHLKYPGGDKGRLKQEITAALNAGKHVILTGPPGTGKSDLATAIAETATDQVAHIDGYQFTTATDSWTTFDTIGGYVPMQDSGGDQLEFDPRLFLSCFRDSDTGAITNEWLVIDELNRANIDDAFGQLFSVLSKDAVTLPYERDEQVRVEWVDNTTDPDIRAAIEQSRDRYPVTPSWRLIGTMNTKDKASLYDLSFAFMRRFAFIHVPAPRLQSDDDQINGQYLDPAAGGNYATAWVKNGISQDVIEQYHTALSVIWAVVNNHRELGPAIIEDLFRHLDAYEGADESAALTSAITTYIFPQLEGLRRDDQKALLEALVEEHAVTTTDGTDTGYTLDIRPEVLERQATDRFGLLGISLTDS